jgi:hypothetical protein
MAFLPPVAALLLFASAALAGPPSPGQPAVRHATVDALDRSIALPIPGRVTLLSFAGPSSGEAVGVVARDLRVAHPGLEILSFLDFSSYPGFSHGFLRRQVVKRQRSAVQETRDAFARAGKPAPDDLDDHVHVIPDFSAENFAHYGVSEAAKQGAMILIGPDGVVKAFVERPSVASLSAAIEAEFSRMSSLESEHAQIAP